MINITFVWLSAIILSAGWLAGKLSKLMKIQSDQALDLCEYIKNLEYEKREWSEEFNCLHIKISHLIELHEIEERKEIAMKTLDKFEDYMKNVDRLNQMINEFKGLVAIIRGEAKKQNE